LLVAVLQNTLGTEVAEYVDAFIPRNVRRAITPENNFLLQIEHAHADLQAVQDVAINVRILKGWHDCARCALIFPSAKNHSNFREKVYRS